MYIFKVVVTTLNTSISEVKESNENLKMQGTRLAIFVTPTSPYHATYMYVEDRGLSVQIVFMPL